MSLPTPFLTKTYKLVDDPEINDVISWNEDGTTFIVWNTTEFARDLLPKHFKHNNFSSFVRQLNTYGFRKVVPDRWEFCNDCFRRGEKKLLCDIRRRKIAVPTHAPVASRSPSCSGDEQAHSSSNSPNNVHDYHGGTVDIIEENERLREENARLNKELSEMKDLCRNVYALMSNFVGNGNQWHNGKMYMVENAVKPLDLLPMTRFREEMQIAAVGGEESNMRSAAEEISARLFGVPIRVNKKRGREGEHDMDLQLELPGEEIKSEPSDLYNSGNDQESWLTRQDNTRNQRVCF